MKRTIIKTFIDSGAPGHQIIRKVEAEANAWLATEALGKDVQVQAQTVIGGTSTVYHIITITMQVQQPQPAVQEDEQAGDVPSAGAPRWRSPR